MLLCSAGMTWLGLFRFPFLSLTPFLPRRFERFVSFPLLPPWFAAFLLVWVFVRVRFPRVALPLGGFAGSVTVCCSPRERDFSALCYSPYRVCMGRVHEPVSRGRLGLVARRRCGVFACGSFGAAFMSVA